ncbi:MAG: hypothetical protein E6H74_03035 [Betaproteobacteria bacterium]|nr:MAG: hypothetical protein E6H74_03035 [Betaproteobacteria bacterium]
MKPSNPGRLLLVAAAISITTGAHALVFSVFTDPHPTLGGGTIGFAYIGDGFVGTVQADGTGNVLYRTNLTGGSVAVFAPTVNIPVGSPSSEHYVSSSLGLGGFPMRDVYVAAADGIIHIDHAGAAGNQFITSVNGIAGSNLASAVRGIMFDSVGTFGNQMLVTTNGGQVYRVTSTGAATLLASTGEDTEGLDIAPLTVFGPFAGQLFVASEGSGLIRAITPGGTITVLNPGQPIAGAEELNFVPLNLGASGNPVEGFYGADYTPNVVRADASQFTGLLGDIIVTGEFSHLVTGVHWTGSGITLSALGNFPNQPEDGTFVTAAIINPCTRDVACLAPEPDSLALLVAAIFASLGAHALWGRRRPRIA